MAEFDLLGVGQPLIDDLDPLQERAAMLLASGWSQSEVAHEVGVSRRTVYTWLHEDEVFSYWYGYLRERQRDRWDARIDAAAGLALERLCELIRSPDGQVALAAVRLALGTSGLHKCN